MKREVKDLQDAVNTIHIKEAMQEEIIQYVKSNPKKKLRFPNRAAAAAIIVILTGALTLPASALVNSFIQERMEKVPEEELTALLDDLSEQSASVDSFTRAYTEEEERKMTELAQKYREGTFPQGELAQAESPEEAERLGFCFLVPTSTFYLPDRELSEEELLQIIDFYEKRDYAVMNQFREEYADELAEQKESEEQKKEEILESGGITKEEALATAKEWLVKIYGITGEGLDCSHYLGEYLPIAGKTEFYHVIWTDLPARQYYYLYIDPQDGSLALAEQYGGNMEKDRPAVTEADALLPELEQRAAAFVEERLQLTYKDCYYSYYRMDDTLSKSVKLIFVKEDNNAFVLTYYWDGTLHSYQKSLFSTYQEKYEELKDTVEKALRREVELFLEKLENAEG